MIYFLVILVVIVSIVGFVLISRQLRQIHVLVNSNLTQVKADLAIALNRIGILETLLSQRSS